MALVLETGSGVRGANAYCTTAFVDAYLADRGRFDDSAWEELDETERQAFVVAASDYLDTKFDQVLKGFREFGFNTVFAQGTLSFSGLPTAAETVTVGDMAYTFVAALTGVADEVLIGGDADGMASNLNDAINALSAGAGLTYGTGTEGNRHASAVVTTSVVTLTALADGESGNDTVFSEAASNATLAAFSGGLDGGSQPLSFPRAGLVDRAGRTVSGIPRNLKWAVSEYASRAQSSLLLPDPTFSSAGTVTRSKLRADVLEVEKVFDTDTIVTIRPYPAADRLMDDYITTPGAIIR